MTEQNDTADQQSPESETPTTPVGTEQLLKSLERTEHALFVLIQTNGRLSAQLANALRRIEALEAEGQYEGALISDLYHHLELEVPSRPVQIDSITGNLVHPADPTYDADQHGQLQVKYHETVHPVYGAYELVLAAPDGGSPQVRPLDTIHPKAQELIVSEIARLKQAGVLDTTVFYGTNFQLYSRSAISKDSVQIQESEVAATDVVGPQDVELGQQPVQVTGDADAVDSERS